MMWPQISVVKVHTCAVRLVGLVYFFAFLGNVVDGPVMWLLAPPSGGWDPAGLVRLNQVALVPALVAFFRPWCWPALMVCWPLWHKTHTNGGPWFHFGWDSMMDEIGFLGLTLAISLTLYDDVAEEAPSDPSGAALASGARGEEPVTNLSPQQPEDAGASGESLRQRRQAPADADTQDEGPRASAGPPGGKGAASPAGGPGMRTYWDLLWGVTPETKGPMEPCPLVVDWSRTLAELSLTLAGFRLFIAAGLMKMRVGSPCWRDYTCLYDHYETQPMPNAAAWYFHNYMPHAMMRVVQWFAIDMAECLLPYLLLSFVVSMGPIGYLVHKPLRESRELAPVVRLAVQFPGRLAGCALILVFVFGMFIGGNYSFLHPLSIVSLVASMGTVRGVPVVAARRGSSPFDAAKVAYRVVAPWLLIGALVFAFLPSLRAYAWIWYGDEHALLGSRLEPLMSSQVTRAAMQMNLGIPYNHHAYFAGAVHERNEMVLFADVGEAPAKENVGPVGWVELDIPYKVGRVDRAPRHTSPLHRRFAWEWWFLALGTDPTWLQIFLKKLCERNEVAWAAVENSPVHGKLEHVSQVKAQMHNYHYTAVGSGDWWTRKELSEVMEQQCK